MKKLIICIFLAVVCFGTVSADLSDWLFCLIKKDQVTISLKQTSWYYKCKDTIVSLERLIIQTAKDLMKIQIYINRGRDLEYRKTVKIEKKALLDKLQLSRITIVDNMKTFEFNLLQKSVGYFVIKITPYKIKLQQSLIKIASLSGAASPSLTSYTLLLQSQIATIDSLSKVLTLPELTDLIAKYVYLKKEIEWKSE